jgi:hypothetical protein
MPPTNNTRAYAAAHFGMRLDKNKAVGLFRSIEGGGVKVESLQYQRGEDYAISRQPGKPKFEDFKVSCGMAMSDAFYEWIADFTIGKGIRHSGEILAADFDYKVRAKRHFYEAIISEFAFPKLDSNDKGAATMTVTISPENMEFEAAGGDETLKFEEHTQAAMLWSSNNFDFTIDGHDDVCRYVSKIDGFSIKQKMSEYHHGGQRHPTKHPGRIELPTLSFYVPEVYAQPLIKDILDRGVKGKYPAGNPLKGHIHTYTNDHVQLHAIEFDGGEFIGMSIDKSDAGSEDIKQVKFEMSIEALTFKSVQYSATTTQKFA